MPRPDHPAPREAVTGIAAQAEGFLLARSCHQEAHREAEALCIAMSWLTAAQAQDVTHHYVDRRMALTRHMLATTAERARGLRKEYETRYQQLRHHLLRRHAAWGSALVACSVGIGCALGVLAR
ncbi:hypothetical protein ACIOKD_02935 [Streptomyces sp. NPDC087844]|uniref:hypothetical protein n=1 Tax=Streptomyces sp. NPDC087844 TaxID=3365805 RepID=UPI00382890EA